MVGRKSSEARIRANKKYNAKTYKRIAVNVRQEYMDNIDVYMKNHNINSNSSLFFKAVKYCIDNNIDLTNEPTAPSDQEPTQQK